MMCHIPLREDFTVHMELNGSRMVTKLCVLSLSWLTKLTFYGQNMKAPSFYFILNYFVLTWGISIRFRFSSSDSTHSRFTPIIILFIMYGQGLGGINFLKLLCSWWVLVKWIFYSPMCVLWALSLPESPGFTPYYTPLSTVKVRTVLPCTLLSFVTVFDCDLEFVMESVV